jgi:hypothetical protein
MMRDLHDNIELRRAISPTRVIDNTAQVSQIIDTANVAALEFAIAIGTVADVDATFQVLVEDGNTPTLTDNATVDPSALLGVVGVAGSGSGASFRFDTDDSTRKIGYIGAKRYVRLTITPALNSGNADISCIAILSRHRRGPMSLQSS